MGTGAHAAEQSLPKGGRKGVRRRQRDFRGSVRALLACQIPDEGLRERLDELGLDGTVLNAIHNGVFEKALRGDVSAARYLRDLAEEERTQDREPVKGADLSRLSDEELRRLAAGAVWETGEPSPGGKEQGGVS